MCNVKKMNRVIDLIGNSTHFVSVTFAKKDKTVRTITFNKKTKKGVKGLDSISESAKKALETSKQRHPNLIRVFDSQLAAKGTPPNACWRMINTDTVTKIVADGIEHIFRD